MNINTITARSVIRLALCLALGTALVVLPVHAQHGLEEKICMRANKIEFHNEDSGFTLEAKCIGKGSWKVTLVNDVVIGDTIVLNFTITHEGNDMFDGAILFASDNVLAKRELKLETVDKDRIDIEFKRDKKK